MRLLFSHHPPCKNWQKTLIFFFLIGLSQPGLAAEESIDELMHGFDDPAPKSNTTPNADGNDSSGTTNTEFDDLLEGFDDSPNEPNTLTSNTEIIEKTEQKWDLTTLMSLSSSYNYQQVKPLPGAPDFRGLSRLKLKVVPELRYKFNSQWDSVFSAIGFYDMSYYIKDRSKYTDETLDSNETELEVRELYFRGTLSNSLDVKIGRQIVVWGKSDSLRVVDVLNPLDFREPGMVDIEDLRLSVTMAKLDYYTGDWNISAIVIPEIRFNKMPPYGSDFYLAGNNPPITEIIPDDVTNPEYALAFIGNFSGWDLSLHFADYYDDQPHFVKQTGTAPRLEHSRLNMAGAAANYVTGSWLYKSEIAYIDGLQFSIGNKKFSRADAMVGIDYNGIADMIFSIETLNRYITNYDIILNNAIDNTKENENQVSFRYSANFIRDKLQLMILTTFFGKSPNDGGFYRGWLDYEIDDGMSIIVGGIIYQAGEGQLLKSLARNDRVFIDYRYTF